MHSIGRSLRGSCDIRIAETGKVGPVWIDIQLQLWSFVEPIRLRHSNTRRIAQDRRCLLAIHQQCSVVCGFVDRVHVRGVRDPDLQWKLHRICLKLVHHNLNAWKFLRQSHLERALKLRSDVLVADTQNDLRVIGLLWLR